MFFARNRNWAKALIIAGLTVLTSGCGGGGELEVAKVCGTVTREGKPLNSGVVVFTPLPGEDRTESAPGKPAQGAIQSDGSYELSTYGVNDGAVVGRHKVIVMPATGELDRGGDDDGRSSRRRSDTPTLELEVKPGDNTLDIKLD